MRDLGTAVATLLATRAGIRARLLVWIAARNRATGTTETLGLWNGEDHAVLTIEGAARTYYGAGGLLAIEPVVTQVGVHVRTHRVSLSPAAPEVLQAIMGYDVRLAPVEIHRGLFDAAGAPVSPPHRVFKGTVDGVELPTPAAGSEGTVSLTLASTARALTRALPTRYSDASMQLRSGDRMFRYADVSGSVPVYWGEKKAGAARSFPGFGSIPRGRDPN
ncbi:hypothetical protein LV780_05970 [Cereibacter azotoformans]|uniref:hypothetical protein n=1 Tax=Cereibacter azotoformans TaxID=43057 RepID=UPI000E35C70C|nr:hypothetical protein [Cereibacter azotoformans]AXQ93402.1 hypothetical protein D0Z66_05970 [Cereibacter sphaeroides]UIJ31728.1 hypothetical protein LV780_05970 [Cereibacter azotoformans]